MIGFVGVVNDETGIEIITMIHDSYVAMLLPDEPIDPTLNERLDTLLEIIKNNKEGIDAISNQTNKNQETLISTLQQNNVTNTNLIANLTQSIEKLNQEIEDSDKETQMWQYISIAVGISVAVIFFILGRKIP